MTLDEALKKVPTETLVSELERRRRVIDHALESKMAWEKREGKILSVIANQWGISSGRLFEKSRAIQVTEARQAAMVIFRELELMSSTEIASIFGMDHSTVLHAVNTHEKRMSNDRFATRYEQVKAAVKSEI